MLASIALVLATLIGLPLGVYTATHNGAGRGRLARVVSMLLLSAPPLIGSLVLVLLAVRTGWLPVGGMTSIGGLTLAGAGSSNVLAHLPRARAGAGPAAGGDARAAPVAGASPTARASPSFAATLARGVAPRARAAPARLAGVARSDPRALWRDGRLPVQRLVRRRGRHRLAGIGPSDGGRAARSRHLSRRRHARRRAPPVSRRRRSSPTSLLAVIDPRVSGSPADAAARGRAAPGADRGRRGRAVAGAVRSGRRVPRLSPRAADAAAHSPKAWPCIRRSSRACSRSGSRRSRREQWPCRGHSRSDPVFLLGADKSSRDVLSRLLAGARISLGIGLLSVALAAVLGGLVGGWAASRGGWIDDAVMRVSDFVLVLPVLYVVLVLRAVLPLVLSPAHVFLLMAAIFPLVGWPFVARGVRAIVAARARARVRARGALARRQPGADSLAPSAAGVLWPHRGAGQPAAAGVHPGGGGAVVRGSGLSRHGADVGDDAARGGGCNELSRFPWTVTPALAIFAVTLVTNLVLQRRPSDRRASPDRPVVRPRARWRALSRSPDHQLRL